MLAITKHSMHTQCATEMLLIIWCSTAPSAKGKEKLVLPVPN